MKTRRSCALVIGWLLMVGSLPVFAQGRKVVKYVPKAAGKVQHIPAVVNPALPLQTQQAVAAFSGAVVERAVLPSTVPAVAPSPATLNAPAPAAHTSLAPGTIPEPAEIPGPASLGNANLLNDTGTNLTGVEVLQLYFPTWRLELGGMFSNEQLDAIERAMKATDEWIFVRNEDGELQARNKDEWNYEDRFLTILRDSEIGFTERQIKQLVGGKGIKGFTLIRYFIIENIHGFIKAHDGQAPRQHMKGSDGKLLKLPALRNHANQGDKEANQLANELEVGHNLSNALSQWPKDSSEYKIVKALYDASRNRRMPAQFIDAYKKWLAEHNNKSPRSDIKENNKSLSLTELRERTKAGDQHAAELAEELEVGHGLSNALSQWPKDSSEYKIVKALYDASRNTKTPAQFIDAYKKWLDEHDNQSPRKGIQGSDGKLLKLSELRERAKAGDQHAAELAQELEIGQGLQNALSNWPKEKSEYKIVKALYDVSRNRQTPAQFVDAYKKWLDEHDNQSPRQNILGADGKSLKLPELRERANAGDQQAAELAKELKVGKALAHALNRWPKDWPERQTVQALYDESRNKTVSKPIEELYQDLVAHIRDYGHYPMQRENSLYINIYHRLTYYQSTMTADGKYQDPWLQKIYELKQWSDRVKRGEVDWTQFPGLFKKHRRTIGEMRREGQQPSPETTKEFETLSAEEQQAIEEMADNMLTLWENFEEGWWQENQKHIITTPNTRVAFDTVLNAVRHQVPGANNVNISNVLEQVNGMQLGQDGQEYYRVIYRGDNPRIPRAEDFHNVEEIAGLPQEYAQPAYQLNAQHISLDGDEESVFNMFLTQGVTDREMSAVIDALTPAGWEVRIGAHELLRDIQKGKIHIHIEQIVPTTEEYAVDISHVLNVNLRQLTQGKNPQQVAKTLRYLFGKYLQEDGHQALSNIQRAF